MVNNLECPCRVCDDRQLGCHGTCAKYLEYKSIIDKMKDDYRKDHPYTCASYEAKTREPSANFRKLRKTHAKFKKSR